MRKVGRNDPCPCGSGRKFKRCCLGKIPPELSISNDEGTAVGTALAWLKTNYQEEVDEAIIEYFFGGPDDEELDAIGDLPLTTGVDINIGEWLLADAYLDIGGKRIRALDLVLGPSGPLLPAGGKEWLRAIGEQSLSLYEVQSVVPGEGFELKDLLRRDAPIVKVA